MLTKGQAIIMAHGAISKALPSEWPDVHLMMSSSDLVRFAELAIADFLERTGQYATNDASREAVIADAVAAEREACAKVCEDQRDLRKEARATLRAADALKNADEDTMLRALRFESDVRLFHSGIDKCAAAIRARGEKGGK